MIRTLNLEKRFGRLQVLNNVNLEIEQGKIIAVLGPNSSGKTTLLKIILGMVRPQSGHVYFKDQEILGQWKYRKDIGYLPQIAKFPENLKVRELFSMIKDIRNDKVNEAPLIEQFDLQEFLNKKLRNLSGGTRQKINIVLAYMFDTPLRILDEPTVGLDPVSLITLKEMIKKEKSEGKTVLFTTHILSVVDELADQIVFLLDGNIYFQGTTRELLNNTGKTNLEQAIADVLKK